MATAAKRLKAPEPVGIREFKNHLSGHLRHVRLPGAMYRQAKAELDAEWPKLTKSGITTALSHEAGDFAERFELREFDTVHLACYAEASRSGGTATEFLSFDAALAGRPGSGEQAASRARR